MTIPELLNMIGNRDQIQAQIDAGMAELGIDAKGLKKIVKAQEAAEAAQKTLAALMGADLGVKPEQVAE